MKHITKPVAKKSEKIILDDNKYAKSTLGDRLEVSGKKQNVLRVLWNFASDDWYLISAT